MLMSFWRLSDNINTIYTIYIYTHQIYHIYIYICIHARIYTSKEMNVGTQKWCVEWSTFRIFFLSLWFEDQSCPSAAKMRAPRRCITEYVVSSISSRIMNDARFEDKTVKIAIPNLRWQSYRFCKDAIFHHFPWRKSLSYLAVLSTAPNSTRRGMVWQSLPPGEAELTHLRKPFLL